MSNEPSDAWGQLSRRTFWMAGLTASLALPASAGVLHKPWYVADIGAAPPFLPRTQGPEPGQPLAAEALVRWPRQVMRLVVKYQQNPLRAARALAYTQVALHDAWVWAGARGLPPAAAEAAAHRAASLMLEQLYPNETPGQFEAQFALASATLAVSGSATKEALAVGSEVAAALMARSLRDGAGRVWPVKQRPKPFEGMWQPTYPMHAVNPAEGMAPHWRPWVTRSAGRHEPPPAPRPGSAIHRAETREVLEVARGLTGKQREAAQAWNLDAGSVTPGGVWMEWAIRHILGRQEPTTQIDHAEQISRTLPVLAALAVALHDAFVDCWRVKLRDWSERPITAVRRDLDPAFVPALVTPGFPAYVSGHATASAAAATVLAHFWPDEAGRLRAMADEAAESRLWGGIHFRSDNQQGLMLGRAIGADVISQLLRA